MEWTDDIMTSRIFCCCLDLSLKLINNLDMATFRKFSDVFFFFFEKIKEGFYWTIFCK